MKKNYKLPVINTSGIAIIIMPNIKKKTLDNKGYLSGKGEYDIQRGG